MPKPSDSPKDLNDAQGARHAGAQAGSASASAIKGWPFAPGSQLDKQVARPWTPKPLYRFNQR